MINEKIKKQALELADQERAELAHMLIDSLHPDQEFESEEDWSKELKKSTTRITSISSVTRNGIPSRSK